jgi:hypothetical protein
VFALQGVNYKQAREIRYIYYLGQEFQLHGAVECVEHISTSQLSTAEEVRVIAINRPSIHSTAG